MSRTALRHPPPASGTVYVEPIPPIQTVAAVSHETWAAYSWNETAEGGFNIVPTHAEGAARLDAIRPVIARWTSSFPSDP